METLEELDKHYQETTKKVHALASALFADLRNNTIDVHSKEYKARQKEVNQAAKENNEAFKKAMAAVKANKKN